MRVRHPSVRTAASLAALLLVSRPSWAGPETIGPAPAGIYGGEISASCAWPSVVSLTSSQGACTGTLIHPELVVYAAHCGDSFVSVEFGDTRSAVFGRSVWTQDCRIHHVVDNGNLGSGQDIAFCRLAEPVTDVAIVPPLMGCETSVIYPGAEVVAVGFGEAEDGTFDVKREVTINVNQVGVEVSAGGLGQGTCQGDSGGPLFIKLKTELNGDDTWRVFGVTSFGPPGCEGGANFGLMYDNMAWLESESGLDLTPCTDAAGNWDPDSRCTYFPLEPGLGGGSWEAACEVGPLAPELAQTCGEPLSPDDPEPPDPTAEGDGDSGDDAEITSETDEGEGASQNEGGGCQMGPARSGWLLLGVPLLWRRRRRMR